MTQQQQMSTTLFGDVGVLKLTLSFVGSGQSLYIACCKSWRQHCQALFKGKTDKWGRDIAPWSTMYRAAFETPSRLQMAVKCGFLPLLSSEQRVRYGAGRWASLSVLQLAEHLGVKPDHKNLLAEALRSGCLEKVRWISSRCVVPWGCSPRFICYAARSGNVELARWVAQQGAELDPNMLKEAAYDGRIDMMAYAKSLGCIVDDDAVRSAAEHGHLAALEWVFANGYAGSPNVAACAAAQGDHWHILEWLEIEHSFVADSATLAAAAKGGHLELFKHLVSKGCEMTLQVVQGAVDCERLTILEWAFVHCSPLPSSPHLLTIAVFMDFSMLRWLREKLRCEWDVHAAAYEVIYDERMEMLEYMEANGAVFEATVTTPLLCFAGYWCENATNSNIFMSWLRNRGAEWPATLEYLVTSEYSDDYNTVQPWTEAAIKWARSQGCTSALHVPVELDTDGGDY